MAENNYDAGEAKLLLAKAADKQNPVAASREQACMALLEDLLGLGGSAEFEVKRMGDDSVVITFPYSGKGAIVGVGARGLIFVGPNKRDVKEVTGLWFNRVSGKLETTSDDTFYVPTPGEPHRRRAALALVVEKALEILS